MIGVVIGIIATQVFKRSTITLFINCILGVAGAIAGLFLRDLFDVQAGLVPGFIAAAMVSRHTVPYCADALHESQILH